MRNSAVRLLAVVVAFGLPGPRASGETADLQPFIDGVVSQALVNHETAGASVALVRDSRLVLAEGYGSRDLANDLPVDARSTQFRIGGLTKVLVWISVLQQVEAGRLELDVDVNRYLTDFQIARNLPVPVTLRHLMTHTPGFEDTVINRFANGPRQVGELGAVLAANQPARVRLPGTLVSYSNYGAALAAHIVATVTQTDWHDYVEAHVLTPLGMSTATTRQPVPERIEKTRSRGYSRTGDRFVERGFTYVPMAPAGSGTATALDLARLMVELLNPKSTGVLSAQSKTLMLSGAYVVNPLVNGMTMGMYEMSEGELRAVGHGGDIAWFHSRMILWPQERIGLFVTTNTSGGERLVEAVVKSVSGKLGFRGGRPNWQPFLSRADEYVGHYIGSKRAYSDYTKLLGLLDYTSVAVDRANEELVLDSGRRYKAVARDVFQSINGAERIAFVRSGAEVAGYSISSAPMISYERARLAQNRVFNLAIVGVWLVLFGLAVVTWPISSFVHRRAQHSAGERLATVLALLTGFLLCYFFWRMAQAAGGDLADFVLTRIGDLPGLLWVPFAVIVLVAVQLVYLYRAWTAGFWWNRRRWHFALLYFAHVGLAWALWYWNLLPTQLLGLRGAVAA